MPLDLNNEKDAFFFWGNGGGGEAQFFCSNLIKIKWLENLSALRSFRKSPLAPGGK